MTVMRTRVAIVGAGPAGLVLSHLLARAGIGSIVLEHRSREYVERRVRAGVLEQGTVDLLRAAGVGDRLQQEGMVHHGLELRFEGERYRIPLSELTGGRCITVYGQQEVVKDLIHARFEADGQVMFEAEAIQIDRANSTTPVVRYRRGNAVEELQADFVAGCDGSHGISRRSVPVDARRTYEKQYPFAWLGVLAACPPSSEELIYVRHERGFALQSMRSPRITRLYLQAPPDEAVENWPDEAIWAELQARMAMPGFTLKTGPIIEKTMFDMHSYVMEPMRYGRLFLAGDAAHVVPPTGAKGMNLAIADARVLAEALIAWYQTGRADLLESYSATCLRRVWRAQHFSWWWTSLLHRLDGEDADFQHRLQVSQLRYLVSSRAAATSFAENYVGPAEIWVEAITKIQSD
jgi:p-hydroxybenzoate 3-monooxygenase